MGAGTPPGLVSRTSSLGGDSPPMLSDPPSRPAPVPISLPWKPTPIDFSQREETTTIPLFHPVPTSENTLAPFQFSSEQHDRDDGTPWLRWTGWPRYFHKYSLLALRDAIEPPGTSQRLRRLQEYWTYTVHDNLLDPFTQLDPTLEGRRQRHEQALTLIGEAFNSVMA